MGGIFEQDSGSEPVVRDEDISTPETKKVKFTGVGSTGDSNQPSQESNIKGAMNALNGSMGGVTGKNVEEATAEEESIASITDEEEDYAEQILFRGYAIRDVTFGRLKKPHFITICTLTPHDISFINNLIFKVINDSKNDDDEVNIPDIELQVLRNMYNIALSYYGIDDKDICEDSETQSTLEVLKASIKRLNELYALGDVDKADKLKGDIVNNLNYRVFNIKQLSNQLIDLISDAKAEFEDKIFEIMKIDSIIPK
jgi:hypothetical protein